MNHSNNNKSGQKVKAELIDLEETEKSSPLKEELSDEQDIEPQGDGDAELSLSENEQFLMMSAPMNGLNELLLEQENIVAPLQSIENV